MPFSSLFLLFQIVEEIDNPEPEPEMPSEAIQIVFVSMWYWWQEIVLISLVTAAVMNLLITRPYIQGMREGFRRRIDQITRGRPVSLFSGEARDIMLR